MTATDSSGLYDAASLRILNAGFEECEQIIERGLGTFLEVGSALVRIHDARLYRQEYATFEVYCEHRWGFTDRRARQLMAAAQIGTVVPVGTESQARELTGLTDEQAVEVYDDAAAQRPEPTAADLRSARERLHPRPATQPTRPTVVHSTTTPHDALTGEVIEPDDLARARFLSQRDTGEVTAPPTEPTNAELDRQLQDVLEDSGDTFRSNLVRACDPPYSVLNLRPERVVATYEAGSNAADALELWLIRTTEWIAQVRDGLPDLPVYTPARALMSVR